MRREIMRPFGLREITTTTFLNADTILIASGEIDRDGNDSRFNAWWATVVIEADGTTTPQNGLGTTTKRVTAYTASNGTFAVSSAWASEGTDHVFIDLYHNFHPDDILRAYNIARSQVWPHLVLHRDHRGIITDRGTLTHPVPSNIRRIDRVYMGRGLYASDADNLLTDGGFELWDNDTTLTNWTRSGTETTVNKESQATGPRNHMILSGQFSARLYVPSNDSTLTQSLTPDVATQDVQLSVALYAYCTVANTLTAKADTVLGAFHGGTGWEWITAEATLGINVTSFDAGVKVLGGSIPATVYLDRAVAHLGPQLVREGPWTPQRGWEWMPPVAGASDGGQIRLPSRSGSRDVLRIVGRDVLSSIAIDTDTTELPSELLEPLYDKVRSILCQDRANSSPSSDSDWAQQAVMYEQRYLDGINSEMMETARPLVVPDRRGPF